MKQTIILSSLFLLAIFSACKKDDDTNNNNNNNNNTAKTIRYDFTATMAGNYSFQAVTDTMVITEIANTSSWTRTVNVTGSDSAIFTVFPPADWAMTTNESDVSLKIFVNNVEKASGTTHFVGLDRPNGITVGTVY